MATLNHPQLPLTLKIGRRQSVPVRDLVDASNTYGILRDESGEGASTFPEGRVDIDGKRYRISYNGRVWCGGSLIMEAQQ